MLCLILLGFSFFSIEFIIFLYCFFNLTLLVCLLQFFFMKLANNFFLPWRSSIAYDQGTEFLTFLIRKTSSEQFRVHATNDVHHIPTYAKSKKFSSYIHKKVSRSTLLCKLIQTLILWRSPQFLSIVCFLQHWCIFNLSETKCHISSVVKDKFPRCIKCMECFTVVTMCKLGILFRER